MAAASARERLPYGRHAGQERTDTSAVPTASNVFFQPLNSSLADPEFSKQYEKQDSWHHKQDQQCNTYHRKKIKLLFTNKTDIFVYILCMFI